MNAKGRDTIPPCPSVRYKDVGYISDPEKYKFIAYVGIAVIGYIEIRDGRGLTDRYYVESHFGEHVMRRTYRTYNEGIEGGKSYIEEEWQSTWTEYHTQPTEIMT